MNREEEQKLRERLKENFTGYYIDNRLSDPKLINEIKLAKKHDIQIAILTIRNLILADMQDAYEKFFNSDYRKFLKDPKHFGFKKDLPVMANEMTVMLRRI